MNDVLVVRASGAGAALAALAPAPGRFVPDSVQLIMAAPLPRRVAQKTLQADFPGCRLEVRPVGVEEADVAEWRDGAYRALTVLTVATGAVSIDIAELRPLMFQPVPVQRPLVTLFGSAVGHLLTVDSRSDILDRHGAARYLIGLAELVLRSALHHHLHQNGTATRCREVIEYVNRHLADPDLTADRVADALFVSRRRLYQLFDDGEGIRGRIRRLRIERAKELLADPAKTRISIGEVARQCGFASAAHFSRTFHKITGQSPGEFRSDSVGGSAREVDRGNHAAEDVG